MKKKLNIQRAIKRPGQLHRDLGIPLGQTIPSSVLAKAAHGDSKTAKRARFAMMLQRLRAKSKKKRNRQMTWS